MLRDKDYYTWIEEDDDEEQENFSFQKIKKLPKKKNLEKKKESKPWKPMRNREEIDEL
jgi:hypothetical protein